VKAIAYGGFSLFFFINTYRNGGADASKLPKRFCGWRLAFGAWRWRGFFGDGVCTGRHPVSRYKC